MVSLCGLCAVWMRSIPSGACAWGPSVVPAVSLTSGGVSLTRAVAGVRVLPTLTVPTAARVSQATRADVVRLTSMTAWVTGVHRTRPPV